VADASTGRHGLGGIVVVVVDQVVLVVGAWEE
jgi:hypothetical protein